MALPAQQALQTHHANFTAAWWPATDMFALLLSTAGAHQQKQAAATAADIATQQSWPSSPSPNTKHNQIWQSTTALCTLQ